MNDLDKLLKHACWLNIEFDIHRYLMSNAHGIWNGAEKAETHLSMCEFYVALFKGIDRNEVKGIGVDDMFDAIHSKTQELTDNMDEEIGFPLEERPDYDKLAPLFFERFHSLALSAIEEIER